MGLRNSVLIFLATVAVVSGGARRLALVGMRSRRTIAQCLLMTTLAYMTVRMILSSVQDQVVYIESEQVNINVDLVYSKDLAPFMEFEPDQARQVLILTYQRCGSSFFGQLFNTNPDVFYLYEPLDSLYSALYGTAEGWNVPSDITSFSNGSVRLIPDRELRAVKVFLQHLLSCKLDALPTETLIHKFWYMFSKDHKVLQQYIKCIRQNNITYTKCQQYTPGYCGMRFGKVNPRRQDECNRYLWNKKFRETSTNPISKNFTGYKECLDNLRGTAEEKCTNHFLESCESRQVRSIKTVRATMASVEHLLRELPNFRVIHLIRDPRGVILSRKEFDSSGRGSFSQGPDLVAREALLYCRTVVKDVILRKQLEKEFPGRIYPIIYDDLVKDPLAYTENIYKFINASIHEKTLSWVIDNTYKKKNSSGIAARWQEKLTFKTYKQITKNCKEFFQEIPYEWPSTEEYI